MLCKDIMRRPVEFATKGETVRAAARKMRDANIGFLPVCETSGRVLGVITDRDIVVRMCAEGGAPIDTRVEDVMTKRVISCKPTDDLHVVEGLMTDYQTARVIVATDDGRLAGVVSLSDIAQHASGEAVDTLRRVAMREILDLAGERSSAKRT